MRDQGVERGEWGILRFGEDGQESDVTVRKLCLGNGWSGRKRTWLRFKRCSEVLNWDRFIGGKSIYWRLTICRMTSF
ncbi:uncharacterized protein K444DRAFT_613588, partial [Hyaloscypha bicolor E]